jgi:hypothetical protein
MRFEDQASPFSWRESETNFSGLLMFVGAIRSHDALLQMLSRYGSQLFRMIAEVRQKRPLFFLPAFGLFGTCLRLLHK